MQPVHTDFLPSMFLLRVHSPMRVGCQLLWLDMKIPFQKIPTRISMALVQFEFFTRLYDERELACLSVYVVMFRCCEIQSSNAQLIVSRTIVSELLPKNFPFDVTFIPLRRVCYSIRVIDFLIFFSAPVFVRFVFRFFVYYNRLFN